MSARKPRAPRSLVAAVTAATPTTWRGLLARRIAADVEGAEFVRDRVAAARLLLDLMPAEDAAAPSADGLDEIAARRDKRRAAS